MLLAGLRRKEGTEPEVERTRRGVRLLQNGSVLSAVHSKPGATASAFDVLAAAVRLFSPGDCGGILGFDGGGVTATLGALGGGRADTLCAHLLFTRPSHTFELHRLVTFAAYGPAAASASRRAPRTARSWMCKGGCSRVAASGRKQV